MTENSRISPAAATDEDECAYVWVRRCVLCRTDDINAAFGQVSLIDDMWTWQCRVCGCPDWLPVRLAYPNGPATGGCPYTSELDR